MLNIRRSRDRLIFNMGMAILVRWHLFIATAPMYSAYSGLQVATFNKGIVFFCGLKLCVLSVLCEGYLQPSLFLMQGKC